MIRTETRDVRQQSRRAGQDGPVDWLAPSRPWTGGAIAAAVLVGVVVGVVAWVFRTEIVPTDPWHYVQSALGFPDSAWVPLGYTRYGMILPLLPVVAVLGNSEASYYVLPLLGSGLLAATIFLLARRFRGWGTGLLAVALGLISPVTFGNLSHGYPDVFSTALTGLALVVALAARTRMVTSSSVPWARLLLVGLLLGWAFEARETSILVWPVVAVALFVRPRLGRVLVWVGLGILGWVITDLAIGQFGYGDALLRVHAFTHQDLAATTNAGDLSAASALVGRDRWFYLTAIPRMMLHGVPGGFWSIVMGVPAIGGLLVRGGCRFLSLLFVVSLIGFIGITGMFVPDHPSGRIDIERYWISFLPWAGLAAATMIGHLVARLEQTLRRHGHQLRRSVLTAICSVAVLVGPAVPLVVSIQDDQTMVVNGGDQLAQLRDYLARTTNGPVRIYTDWYTLRLLPVYQHGPFGGPDQWRGEQYSLTGKGVVPRPGGLVAVNSLDNQSCPFCNLVINQWNDSNRGPVPKSWTEVWASTDRNLVLYRVGSS